MEASGRHSAMEYGHGHRTNFNHTQQVGYSPQKPYPGRSHTLDENDMAQTERTASGLQIHET